MSATHQKTAYTHYDVLQLPRHQDWSRVSQEDIKSAYRHALLIHHPDKAAHVSLQTQQQQQQQQQQRQQKPRSHNSTPVYSIDDIVVAYEVLTDPGKRRIYNETLDKKDGSASNIKGTHVGVEVFDLEDLQHDERKNIWFKACRCGDEQGYVLTETDLDNESQHGEIYVGCQGCSLFIKVLFALAEG
ncbi:Diphthamide biosynthesis protein 4 [Rhinocladiella similis]